METNNSYYLNLILLLKTKVSEFVSIFDEDDGVYPILGDFGQFMLANIDNDEISKKCFLFINEAIAEGDALTKEAISIELFERFYENDELVEFARKNLSANSLVIFDEYLNKYRTTYI